MIKKELGVYRRVPGSSDQKTDLFAFGEHPKCGATVKIGVVWIFSTESPSVFNLFLVLFPLLPANSIQNLVSIVRLLRASDLKTALFCSKLRENSSNFLFSAQENFLF